MVFPLSARGEYGGSRDWLQAHADGSDDNAFIGNMIFPLTHDTAQARWALFNPGITFPFDDVPEHFGCRHWDTSTRRCREYAARPAMCARYPYTAECPFCGYTEPAAWWEWVAAEGAFRETAFAKEQHAADWQMPADWEFTWDGEWLRPVAQGG